MIVLFMPVAAFGDECVEGDCANGKGTMVYSTGHKYTGEFKDGVRHGEGNMLLPGGRSGSSARLGWICSSDEEC